MDTPTASAPSCLREPSSLAQLTVRVAHTVQALLLPLPSRSNGCQPGCVAHRPDHKPCTQSSSALAAKLLQQEKPNRVANKKRGRHDVQMKPSCPRISLKRGLPNHVDCLRQAAAISTLGTQPSTTTRDQNMSSASRAGKNGSTKT